MLLRRNGAPPGLANWAEMSPPLRNNNLFDRRATDHTTLTKTSIDKKLFLKTTSVSVAVDVVPHRGAAEIDPFFQDNFDGAEETFFFIDTERRHPSQRMDGSLEKGFVRINVSNACHKALVQE